MILLPVKRSVPEHFTQRIVVIDQFLQPVVVDIQIQPDHATHKNASQRHPRVAIAFIDLQRKLRLKQFKQLAAQRAVSHTDAANPLISSIYRREI